jgi:hypothetical protein
VTLEVVWVGDVTLEVVWMSGNEMRGKCFSKVLIFRAEFDGI